MTRALIFAKDVSHCALMIDSAVWVPGVRRDDITLRGCRGLTAQAPRAIPVLDRIPLSQAHAHPTGSKPRRFR